MLNENSYVSELNQWNFADMLRNLTDPISDERSH